MGDKIRNSEQIAAAYFFDKQSDALFEKCRVGRGEVDQITVMTDCLVKLEPIAVRFPLRDGFIRQWRAIPLLLVLGKDLYAIKMKPLGFEQRFVHSASDREMGAEHLTPTVCGIDGNPQASHNVLACNMTPDGDSFVNPRP